MKIIKMFLVFSISLSILMIPTMANENVNFIENLKVSSISEDMVEISFTLINMDEVENLLIETTNIETEGIESRKEELSLSNESYAISIGLDSLDLGEGTFKSKIQILLVSGDEIEYTTEAYSLSSNDYKAIKDSALDGYSSQVEKLVTESNIIVQNNGYSYTISVDVSDTNIIEASFPTWTSRNGQDDLVWAQGRISNGKAIYTVDMKDHNYEEGEYLTHVYLKDGAGTVITLAVPSQILKRVKPEIKNIQVKNDGTSYTIICDVIGNEIESVEFPTWTVNNGQDDLIWSKGTLTNGKATFTVNMKNHNYEEGEYLTHIYLSDKFGISVVALPIQVLKKVQPEIKNIQVQNNGSSYTITCELLGTDIKSVEFPSWTTKGGQDDLTWEKGTVKGNIASFTVEMRDHKYEEGDYLTHIYLNDIFGVAVAEVPNQILKKPQITLSNIQVNNTGDKYTVTGKVDGLDIIAVELPTWSVVNGQDDILWEKAELTGNTFSYTIDSKNHKYEEGDYQTHIYAYDASGQYISVEIPLETIEQKLPELKNVKISNRAGGYTIECDMLGTEVVGIEFPTWSIKGGQDDIYWGKGRIQGNKVTYSVDFKDHSYETGDYQTHIYVYGANGKNAFYAMPIEKINNAAPVISNIKVSDVTAQGYLVTCTVEDDYGLDYVSFPTWSSVNGQDDLTWEKGTVNGNTVSYRVYVKDHKYDFGEYNTHIYAYDKAGKYSGVAIPTVSIGSVGSVGWSIVNGKKYLYDAAGKLVGSGILVIDVSENNGNIDWNSVLNSGVDGVILRSSYGYNFNNNGTTNFSQMDKCFKRNISELNRLGVPYGIYHFSYAKSEGEGYLEANYLLNSMKEAGARPTLPIFYDLESSSYVGDKSNQFYTTITQEFASVISSAGYKVGVYANYNWWTTKLIDSSFNNYIKWVAHYGSDANNNSGTANPNWHPSSEYKIWQYSSGGKVNGINSRVDMNILYN